MGARRAQPRRTRPHTLPLPLSIPHHSPCLSLSTPLPLSSLPPLSPALTPRRPSPFPSSIPSAPWLTSSLPLHSLPPLPSPPCAHFLLCRPARSGWLGGTGRGWAARGRWAARAQPPRRTGRGRGGWAEPPSPTSMLSHTPHHHPAVAGVGAPGVAKQTAEVSLATRQVQPSPPASPPTTCRHSRARQRVGQGRSSLLTVGVRSLGIACSARTGVLASNWGHSARVLGSQV